MRYNSELSFLLLDIDNFKNINDTHGHQIGDQVLIDLCIRFGNTMRSTDILARYGGEEFAILLPHIPLNGAEKVAEKIRQEIAGTPFPIGESEIDVSISCGVSSFTKGSIDTIDTIIMEADKALYQAKKEGKNRVVVSPECMEAVTVLKKKE